jgi:hypothetical protein
MAELDQTLALAITGYAWLPELRRRAGGRPVPLRVMGQRRSSRVAWGGVGGDALESVDGLRSRS